MYDTNRSERRRVVAAGGDCARKHARNTDCQALLPFNVTGPTTFLHVSESTPTIRRLKGKLQTPSNHAALTSDRRLDHIQVVLTWLRNARILLL